MGRRPLGLQRPDCTAVTLDGRVSVHCPDSRSVHTLSSTATSVWHLLDGVRTLDEVVDDLASVFGAPTAVVELDVQGVVAELVGSGLVLQPRGPAV